MLSFHEVLHVGGNNKEQINPFSPCSVHIIVHIIKDIVDPFCKLFSGKSPDVVPYFFVLRRAFLALRFP